jgi:uncharacterized membrane protein YedE/YeeE
MSATTEPGAGIARIRRTRAEVKPTPSQIPYAVMFLALLAAFGAYLSYSMGEVKLAFCWVIAVALGLSLQRARFCFTAAMRDPILTGGTNLTKAVMIGLAVVSAGFAALQIGAYLKTGHMADAMQFGDIGPVGIHTAVGAFLFGIGAVLGGGCASGTLMRVGEGFGQNFVTLGAFIVGSGIAAGTWPWWRDILGVDLTHKIYLPVALGGFVPALVVQFGLLFAAWLLADWWGKRTASSH